MSNTLIIVEKEADFEPYFSSENVLTFEQYVAYQYHHSGELKYDRHTRLRIINLCKSNEYLSIGYYCSLLAEARGHSVIPSVRTLNDLSQRDLTEIELSFIPPLLANKLLKNIPALSQEGTIHFKSFFGKSLTSQYAELARKVFQHFPCPIVDITLSFDKVWQVQNIATISPDTLTDEEENNFAVALDDFCSKVWRKKRSEKSYRYDLAILVDHQEKLPPSDKKALKKFIAAGKALSIDCELITKDDYHRLPEYDGLFIRTTTAIDHYSYRFAKKADIEGLVVIDDPTSILRCTNKIYLADLFSSNNVKAPKTQLLFINDSANIDKLEQVFTYPIVLKIPDGAFSIGVEKVKNQSELSAALNRLFTRSSLLIAQEYLYTEFDWRIGILNGKPIFACRYYMVNNHWQIYQHDKNKVASGSFETLPTFEAPKWVLESAIKATNPIGNGFYGVDIKEKDGIGYVIEVNDNPSIDSGVEDLYLGNELYQIIMSEFLNRIEKNVTQPLIRVTMDNLMTDNEITFSHDKLSIYNFGDNFLSEKSNIDKRFFEGGIRYRDAVQIIVPTGEYWLFDYGVVVFWAVDEDERQALLNRLKSDNTTHIKKIEEHLCFTFSNELIIKKDIVILPDNDPLTRLAISHALAQSNKLMEYEIQAQNTIIDYSHIPEELAKNGKISLSRKQIAKIIGTLLSTKSDIILHYGLLDTPDFIWEYPEYEATYERMARYMDIHQRVELLSKKLSTIHELFEMLAAEQKHQHSAFLEWIIIVLIGIEIILFFVQELKDLAS